MSDSNQGTSATRALIEKYLTALTDVLVANMKQSLAKRDARMATLEQRLHDLEATKTQLTEMGKQLEELRTETNYLRWTREQETAKA